MVEQSVKGELSAGIINTWPVFEAALARSQSSLPRKEKQITGDSIVRTRSALKSIRSHRFETKRKAIGGEIRVAQSVEMGSKLFFNSVKWLKSQLRDPLG